MSAFEAGLENQEELADRHAREISDLKDNIEARLKTCKKSEKKVMEAYAAQQMQDLKDQQANEIELYQEWLEMGGKDATIISDSDAGAMSADTIRQQEEEAAAAQALAEAEAAKQRIAKAQRKKNKKDEKVANTERMQQEMRDNMGPAARDLELTALRKILLPLQLGIKEISSDGNCLFRAISDQLAITDVNATKPSNQVKKSDCTCSHAKDHASLRACAAEYIQTHRDDFEPFLDEGLDFQTYCRRIGSAVSLDGQDILWGGQIEIRALSEVLSRTIEVYAADAPVLRMLPASGDNSEGGPPLRISYHAHFFALGAHYNSVIAL